MANTKPLNVVVLDDDTPRNLRVCGLIYLTRIGVQGKFWDITLVFDRTGDYWDFHPTFDRLPEEPNLGEIATYTFNGFLSKRSGNPKDPLIPQINFTLDERLVQEANKKPEAANSDMPAIGLWVDEYPVVVAYPQKANLAKVEAMVGLYPLFNPVNALLHAMYVGVKTKALEKADTASGHLLELLGEVPSISNNLLSAQIDDLRKQTEEIRDIVLRSSEGQEISREDAGKGVSRLEHYLGLFTVAVVEAMGDELGRNVYEALVDLLQWLYMLYLLL